MSYVRANTSNPVRGRNLAPTSAPFSRLGWFNGPYANYPQPANLNLNGEFVPPPPPARNTQYQGALTYRVDPRTGQYRLYATDILPRGVFRQVAFQPPAPPARSALGVSLGDASGCQLVQVGGRQLLSRTSPRRCACSKRGCSTCSKRCACKRRLRLGDDSFGKSGPDALVDSAAGMATEQGDVAVPGFTPQVVGPAPGSTRTTNIILPNPFAAQQPPAAGSWWDRSTNIAGKQIANSLLATGGGLIALLALGAHGRRR